MKQADESPQATPPNEVLQQTFYLCYKYVAEAADPKKALSLARDSHTYMLNYFKNLQKFRVEKDGKLTVSSEISENDILAFSVWIQHYLSRLKDFMIGLGTVDPHEITAGVKQFLNDLKFYEFYNQAEKLSY